MIFGHLLLLMMAALLFIVPRRHAVIVFITGVLFMHQGVSFNVLSLHFFPGRVLICVGLLRILFRGESHASAVIPLDVSVIATALAYFLSGFFHKNVMETLVFRGGMAFDIAGAYFLCRQLVSGWNDVLLYLRHYLLLMIPFALFMLTEQRTSHNAFSALSNIQIRQEIRNGRLRAEGPFRVSILAGTAAAVILPFAIALRKANKRLSTIALVSILLVVFASGSSGPWLSVISAVFALALWRYRLQLRMILWGTLLCLLGLQLIMNSNVWYLMTRIDVVGGSDSWYRARLIDVTLEHVGQWWLAGTDYTLDWMPTGTTGEAESSDLTNNFVLMAVRGGLPLLLSYIAVMISFFRYLLKTLASLTDARLDLQFTVWCFGAFLFSHIISMFGVDYFDQSETLLFATLGVLGSGCNFLLSKKLATKWEAADGEIPAVQLQLERG
jgi:hypothetical protein